MNSEDVIKYLDSTGISHSKLTRDKVPDYSEQTEIEVYNIKIVDALLDTTRIVFYNDRLLSFHFGHIMNYSHKFWEKKAEFEGNEIKKPKDLIIYENKLSYCANQLNLFYEGLVSKYGQPEILSNSENCIWQDFNYGKGINSFEIAWEDSTNLVKITLVKSLVYEVENANTMAEGERKSFGYHIDVKFKSEESNKKELDLQKKVIQEKEADRHHIDTRKKNFQDAL